MKPQRGDETSEREESLRVFDRERGEPPDHGGRTPGKGGFSDKHATMWARELCARVRRVNGCEKNTLRIVSVTCGLFLILSSFYVNIMDNEIYLHGLVFTCLPRASPVSVDTNYGLGENRVAMKICTFLVTEFK